MNRTQRQMLGAALAVTFSSAWAPHALAQCPNPNGALPSGGDEVAIGGGRMVFARGSINNPPTPLVEVLAQQVDGSWQLEASFVPPNATGNKWHVDTDGERIAVGMPSAALVDIFERNGTTWTYQGTVGPQSPTDASFASSVAIHSGLLVVGASRSTDINGIKRGRVLFYEETAGGTWIPSAVGMEQPSTLNADARFGHDVDMSADGSELIVGAPQYGNVNNPEAGRAFMYDRVGSGWTPTGQLGSTSSGTDGQLLGYAVAVDNGTAIAGAPNYTAAAPCAGRAYLSARDSGGAWTPVLTVPATDPGENGAFGMGVAVDDDYVLITAPGSNQVTVPDRIALLVGGGSDPLDWEIYRFLFGDYGNDEIAVGGNSVVTDSGDLWSLVCELEIGDDVCTQTVIPNSTGQRGRIQATGSRAACGNPLTLIGDRLPPGKTAYFLASMSDTSPFIPPGSDGNLCLGQPTGRFDRPGEYGPIDMAGIFTLAVDTCDVPMGPPQPILAGETWYFQLWHRDVGASSNFTNAVKIRFY